MNSKKQSTQQNWQWETPPCAIACYTHCCVHVVSMSNSSNRSSVSKSTLTSAHWSLKHLPRKTKQLRPLSFHSRHWRLRTYSHTVQFSTPMISHRCCLIVGFRNHASVSSLINQQLWCSWIYLGHAPSVSKCCCNDKILSAMVWKGDQLWPTSIDLILKSNTKPITEAISMDRNVEQITETNENIGWWGVQFPQFFSRA